MSRKSLPKGPLVAPSIYAADFSRLGEQIAEVMAAGVRVIHVDVMDGHFVPPITIGPVVVESIADQVHGADGFLDVHLMIEQPEGQLGEFARAGADNITIHYEATENVHYALMQIREHGCSAGLALNPATPVECMSELTSMVDVVLCMSVNPGWSGQAFIERSIERIEQMRALLPDEVAVEVDGGIDGSTAPECAGAGAEIFVAGSAVFGAKDPADAYRAIAQAVGAT